MNEMTIEQVIAFVKQALNDEVTNLNVEHQFRYAIAGGKKWRRYPLPFGRKSHDTQAAELAKMGIKIHKKQSNG